MKKLFFPLLSSVLFFLTACYNQVSTGDHGAIDVEVQLKGDSTRYGLACDGCSDSVIVLLPNEGGDPIKFDIVTAKRNGMVYGSPQIGDALAIVPNPIDPLEAEMVIDLEQMKGTWTFQVLPKLKPNPTKTEEEILAGMSDSMKAALFIPREYGFTLKSYNQASPVGYVMKANSLEDESPVEYPKVTVYTSWHIFNGRLYIYKDTIDEQGHRIPQDSVGFDSGSMRYLSADSMAALFGKKVMQYHRKKNALEANKEAQKAEEHNATISDDKK
jgi:putative lipoprotein